MAGAIRLTCLSCGQANRIPADRVAQGPRCGTCGAALVPKAPVEVDAATLDRAVGSDDLPLLVDFWAPWCGPCRVMAPEFAKAAAALWPAVRFAKLNTDSFPDASARHAVRGIPALVLFRRGRETGRLTGVRPAADIAAFAGQPA